MASSIEQTVYSNPCPINNRVYTTLAEIGAGPTWTEKALSNYGIFSCLHLQPDILHKLMF